MAVAERVYAERRTRRPNSFPKSASNDRQFTPASSDIKHDRTLPARSATAIFSRRNCFFYQRPRTFVKLRSGHLNRREAGLHMLELNRDASRVWVQRFLFAPALFKQMEPAGCGDVFAGLGIARQLFQRKIRQELMKSSPPIVAMPSDATT